MDENRISKRFEHICNVVNPFAQRGDPNAPDLDEADYLWLVEFCEFHGLRGEILRGRPGGHQVSDWTNAFRPWGRQYAFRTLQMVGEVAALADAFEAAGIAAVFFKGATLGEQLYGGAQHREYVDIDVLVAPECRQEASDVAGRLGYQPIIQDSRMRQRFFDHVGQHMHHNNETGLTLDLHWRFVGLGPFPVETKEVLRDRTVLELGGRSVPVPCTDDLALILAGHGQKEGWASFGWALDFAKFAACNPAFDWRRAVVRAEAKKSVRALLAGTLLVERLFRHSIDSQMLARAEGLPNIVAEVEGVVSRYVALTEREAEDDLNSASRLCDTRLERTKVLWSLAVTPTIGDFEAMPLRPQWWWAYRFIRPVRLGWRKFRGRRREESAFWMAQAQAAKGKFQTDGFNPCLLRDQE